MRQGPHNILAFLCAAAPLHNRCKYAVQTSSTFETATLVLKSARFAVRIAEYATSSIAWQPSDALLGNCSMAHWQPGDAPTSGDAPAPPRQRRRVDVDGVVAATFGLENGGRLPHAVPLRDAVQLLVAAWDEAADWSRYESGHDPRDRGRDRGPPRDWHPPLAPRRFSPEASEIIRQYHAGLRPPPPPKPHERFGNSDEDVAR